MRQYGPFVSALCRRMIRDPQKAEDAAQEAWVQILNAWPEFRSQSAVSTWIYRIVVRSLSASWAREKLYTTRYLKAVFHGESLSSPYESREETARWAREQCDRCLTGILHCLDTDSRLVFIFREIAGLAWGEIAAIFETTETAARQLGSRGKRKVRRFMDEECRLLNPGGPCRCRMDRVVRDLDLAREYQTIQKAVDRLRLFQQAESLLPRKDFWREVVTT